MSKPDELEIRQALESVLESAEFKRSARLSGFLEYIVEKTLCGEGPKISGYTIGVDVFKKPADFDSDNDSSVRVEAVRLRKALALYYHEEGRSDPLNIKVPRGGYRPLFLRSEPEEGLEESLKKSGGNRRFLSFVLVVSFLAILVGMIYYEYSKSYEMPRQTVVAISPFQFIGKIASKQEKNDLVYLLNQKLSRFSSLRNIILGASDGQENKDYDYVLEGMVSENADDVTVNVRLMDTQQNTMVWNLSRKFVGEEIGEDNAWMEKASAAIVSAIASMHGVIDTMELKKYANVSSLSNEGQRCLLEFRAYDNNKTALKHAQARECLEKLVKHFPDYSLGWSYLSWLYGDEVRNNINPRIGGIPAKARALEAGLKAVELNQRDARAHMYLSSAAMLSGDVDLARRHIQISIDLNPYDTDVLASAAWKYGRMGEWELSRKYGEAALELNQTPPKWYHGGVFTYYFYKGDFDRALFHALSNFQEDDFFSRLCLIASYAGAGQMREARVLVEKTKTKFPEKMSKLNEFLKAWHLNPEWQKILSAQLLKAGVHIDEVSEKNHQE